MTVPTKQNHNRHRAIPWQALCSAPKLGFDVQAAIRAANGLHSVVAADVGSKLHFLAAVDKDICQVV